MYPILYLLDLFNSISAVCQSFFRLLLYSRIYFSRLFLPGQCGVLLFHEPKGIVKECYGPFVNCDTWYCSVQECTTSPGSLLGYPITQGDGSEP